MKTRVLYVSFADLLQQPAIEAARLVSVIEALERVDRRTSIEWHRTETSQKPTGLLVTVEDGQ
jgi:hypothetical protein